MPTSSLVDVFKAVIRYHYREFAYNGHWGGGEVSSLFERENPILLSHNLSRSSTSRLDTDEEDEFDLWCYIEQLTTPVYPKSPEEGVYLYWGFDDGGGRGLYARNLQEMHSPELAHLADQLRSANYYSLEEEWHNRLAPYAGRISQTMPTGLEFYRARIGVRDEATRLTESFEDPEIEVVFPYVDGSIGAPPQTAVTGGRLNRAHIAFLYLADTLETAVAEVRPHPGHVVSLGRFRSERALNIANLAGVRLLPFASTERDLDAFVLFRNIEHAFAMPVLPDDNAGYQLTQFIADMLRRLGFDGVTFRSSVTSGVNFVAFDPHTFSYVSGSGDVRSVRSLSYVLDEVPFELERSKELGTFYYPKVRKR